MAVKLFEEETAEFVNISELPIDMIKPNPYQQRKYFDFYSLNRLTESIKKYGVLQPITVRVINGKSYELIAGERRLRASKAAGLKTIPVVFIDADEEESSVISFIENLQRKNIDYIEEAQGFKSFIDDFGMSIEEISLKMGVSQSLIRRRLKILEFSEDELSLIRENKLDEQYITAVLKIPDREIRMITVKDIIEQDMTVKKAEDYVEKILFCMRFGNHGQKVKSSFNDMKLFTNSIKQSVDAVRNAGIPAYYDIIETADSYQITIKIINNSYNEVEIVCE
ncbi:Nucleoid occlusion protein [bioreactor metagenome]|uniref:Nucleoid occlusion protein n=1 Tax=bioreactor metagenome TaxID=1076179 RepID=A0A644Z5M0_9ZZZZ|nr:ParB/RepB/Spo0J family partition protein [Candidatus Metalachnospira sp.]